jgi:hypothetical protein
MGVDGRYQGVAWGPEGKARFWGSGCCIAKRKHSIRT